MEKMDALGIEKNDVNAALIKGMRWKEKDTEKWHANMAGVECVFMKNEDALFIITVYNN
ncbi:hypothetical protein J4232_03710 [Candidatus Woesearchaeota archaeon]|nr:hypothetical protein [Candidatus Woesearchaeota archaeon]